MRRERSKTHQAASQPRPPGHIHEEPHDVYGIRGKLPEPTACPSCGLVYREGRWIVATAPFGTHQSPCPACRRIADDFPAGIVTIAGQFAAAHREEIENLVRNIEKREREDHPLKRIFAIERSADGLRIPTTDAKLARGIGHALHHAYHGELDEPETGSEPPIRVHWTRD